LKLRKEKIMTHPWFEDDITINKISIHYTRTGRGDKPPLVLLHGFSDNGKCWTPVARDLEADYDLILPDARGHGLSARVQPGEVIDMAADTAALIEVLKLDKPVVGGHSMGASVTAELGGRFAGLVRALILEDPAWRVEPPAEDKIEQEERPNPFQWILGLKNMSVEELMVKCHADSPTWGEAELRPWAESKQQIDPNIVQTLPPIRFDWQAVVRGIVCPTLLITAEPEKGAIVTPQIANRAMKMNNFIRVAHLDGAGHNIRRENYPEYMQALRSFLKDIGW
jgi:pimeloyl-ACP methyl ester carboxylesterase